MTKRYRPSNGTEGDIFQGEWCARYQKDTFDPSTQAGEMCPILGKTLFYNIEDPEYPDEWQYDDQGQPICTAFIDEDDQPYYRCTQTLDMFDGAKALQPAAGRKKEKKIIEFRPMSENEKAMAIALGSCTFLPGSAHKRFSQNLAAAARSENPKITERQRAYMHRLIYRYRRQIAAEIQYLRLDDAELNPIREVDNETS